jgi:hypothetical protein
LRHVAEGHAVGKVVLQVRPGGGSS